MIRSPGNAIGTHVFAAGDGCAFDFNGWVDEGELLRVNAQAATGTCPEWTLDVLALPADIEEMCALFGHRRLDEFHQDPWDRAVAYVRGWDPI